MTIQSHGYMGLAEPGEEGKQEMEWGWELRGGQLVKLWGLGVLSSRGRDRMGHISMEGTSRDCEVSWAGLSPLPLVLVPWDLRPFV